MISTSPLLLVLYLCGTTGILLSIGDMLSLNIMTSLLLVGFTAVLNIIFWFLYTRHGKIFIYVTAIMTIAAGLALVPQVYRVTVHVKFLVSHGLPLTNLSLDMFFVLLFVFLITFFLFALEFVIRNHAIMLIGGLALLLLVPIFDSSMNFFTMLFLGIYEVGFIVVNMSERRSGRNVMTMPHRSGINVASVVLALAIVTAAILPSFLLEQTTERQLFGASYAADSLVKDIIAHATGSSANGVNNGTINRGNLYQTGRNQLAITLDQMPTDTLYLKGYTGRDYNDSQWSNAFTVTAGNLYGNTAYQEPFMDSVINDVYSNHKGDIPYSFYYLIYDSSDPIAEMYYLLSPSTSFNPDYFEVVEIGDTRYLQVDPEQEEKGFLQNDSAASIWFSSLTNSTAANIYSPYFAQNSESRIVSKRTNRSSYQNRCLSSAKMADASAQWDDNPIYSLLADTYRRYILREYIDYPAAAFSRMEALCQAEPLTDLNEITTYILVTLQNKATYTTTPGNTPYNKDVIDYFLFDNGKGYCVHFASAAALMYRMYGIPARYVTGYVASPSDFSPNEQYPGYFSAVLTDKSAHAWVEIFLKDYGWVPVEVTPTTEGVMNASYPGFNQATMRSIMARHGWTFRGETIDNTADGNNGGGFAALSANVFKSTLFIIPAALIGLVIFLILRRRRMLSALSAMSCRQLFDRIIRILHYRRLLRNYTGSEEDFAEQLAAVSSLSIEDTSRIIRIMLEVNYAPEEVSADDRSFMEQAYRTLAADLYARTPPLKKPFFKLVHAFL